MKKFYKLIIASLTAVLFLLLIDYLFGSTILKKINKSENIVNNSITLKSTIEKNNFFNHNFIKNLISDDYYGSYKYKICTNEFSLRLNCNNKKLKLKDYDWIFIGDKFIEGVKLDYEDTFIGKIEKLYPKYVIGNLGVRSYSPSIYYLKIKKYLEMGFKFKEVFVFIDIDDIHQEATQYKLVNNELIYNNLNDLQKNSSYIKSTKKNISFRKTLKIRFPLSYQILYQIKYYKVPKPVYRFNHKNQIAAWTYTNNITFNYDVNLGIKNSILALDKLYKLLKKNNIKLAIGIYPYPNQLLYDSLNSKQIKIWENFCISRCSNFLNFFPVLFNNQNMLDYDLAIKIKNNNFFKNDTNLNEIGNQKIANEFKKLYKN